MRCGVPLLGDRVAPRCRCADGLLIVVLNRGRVRFQRWLPLEITNPLDLISALRQHRLDLVVCGGINHDEREALTSLAPRIVENVACSAGEVVAALQDGSLRPGFGFAPRGADPSAREAPSAAPTPAPAAGPPSDEVVDCLSCRDRRCLRGEPCRPASLRPSGTYSPSVLRMLEAATDVSSEDERKLCRLAELVYFCLEMGYRRIGIAFCVDLAEPAEILASVIRRSFETVAVCCKVGGTPGSEPEESDGAVRTGGVPPIACNPVAQARLLNRAGTDLNVIVGLCMGSDCVFTQESEAPVTTLFVKDKSLANNPIGAVYSEYYLRESVTGAPTRQDLSEAPVWPEQRSDRSRASDAVSGREDVS
jgi:uncharacterized metal-binding protein